MERPHYKPQPKDIEWAKRVLALIAESGIVVFPATKLEYMVLHSAKK